MGPPADNRYSPQSFYPLSTLALAIFYLRMPWKPILAPMQAYTLSQISSLDLSENHEIRTGTRMMSPLALCYTKVLVPPAHLRLRNPHDKL